MKVFRFPNDIEERNTWIRCLPNDKFVWNDNKRICIEHWPSNFPSRVVNRNGTTAPSCPPSVFEGVPPSCVPSQPSKKRISLNSSKSNEELTLRFPRKQRKYVKYIRTSPLHISPTPQTTISLLITFILRFIGRWAHCDPY